MGGVRVIAAAWILLGGCGRVGFDPVSTLTVERGPDTWSPSDLTTAGGRDWMHFGLGSSLTPNRKANVSPLITEPVHIGDGVLFATDKGDEVQGVSWSDGTPTMSATNVSTTMLVDTAGVSGDGFELTVEGDDTLRTLRVYAGVWCARIRFSAEIDDPNLAPVVDTGWDFPVSAFEVSVYRVDYAANLGETLTISMTIDQNYCTTGDVGEVWLTAITVL